jgi:peptidoglycan/xylan/chitin deacetylase (PgdA/CDA1 family)
LRHGNYVRYAIGAADTFVTPSWNKERRFKFSFHSAGHPTASSYDFYVVTGYVGRDNEWDLNWGGRRFRHLDWGEMRQMREAGIEFGSHGVSHRDLRRLSDRELESELYDSKRSLEDKLGAEVSAFCYPFGRYDRRVRQAVIDAGYRSACSHSPGMPNSQVDVFALRRCGVYITDILWDFRNKVDQGSRGFWVQDLWSRTVNYCAGGTAVIQRLGRLRRRQ